MYNPRLLKPTYFRQRNYGKGYYKKYYPCFTNVFGMRVFISRKYFRTATEAVNRAKEILDFWIKLHEKINKIQTPEQNSLGNSVQSEPLVL